MARIVGRSFRFAYPEEFTTLPEYSKHRGEVVTVIRRLTKDEADTRMYLIQANDGWEGHAFPGELKPLRG